MNAPLKYNETVTLMTTSVDEYGADVIEAQEVVMAIVEQNTGYTHGNNQTAVVSDAIVYVDPLEPFVRDNFNRLEEMLVIVQLFGVPESKAWFKVTNVTVARDHLLSNRIDNIRLSLKKTSEVTKWA